MFGMDTPATTRNRTISRSGLDSVAISAGSRAQCLTSTRRWPGTRESAVGAGAGSAGERIGGGTTEVPPPRAAPPPGPAAVLSLEPHLGFRLPAAGFGKAVAHRSGGRPTHECPPRRAERSGPVRGHHGEDTDTTAGAQTIATILERACLPPNGWGSASRRTLVTPGSGARVRRIVAGYVNTANPFDRLSCTQAVRGRSDADPGESTRGLPQHDRVHSDRLDTH
jgi:hypothetical protein